ncbi:putative FHA domain protein SNIP1 [Aspergillus melleus]|uniref:putative FHA domain protein SNIP1 n=1 Tax=Aspergillus melleus TaxID=138277 RepID=UPI001E8DEB96|nr:uncharacterized protein LDX57_004671 [Aspergillus melleus]KAH8426948.1 hypothetical protein LDX57_004671 [Aspergillus melleus]
MTATDGDVVTTSTRAAHDAAMTTEARAGTVREEDPLAAHPVEAATTEIPTAVVESVETATGVQTTTEEDAGIAPPTNGDLIDATGTEMQTTTGKKEGKGLPEDIENDAYKSEVSQGGEPPVPPVEKEKPNFGNTGRLAAESNTVAVNGESVVLKYHEPPEARKPPGKEPWRLYVFKGEDLLEVVELNERSCWLIGRERLVVDFPLDHPSCSKQHAALQFRFVDKRNEFGDRIGKVKPYLIDLESANGSSVNGEPVPGGRYVEVRDKDVLKFGLSSREYVLMLPPPE